MPAKSTPHGVSAFCLAVSSMALAFAATFLGPMANLPQLAIAAGYLLPILLGLVSAWMGGKTLEGGGFGFFAILVGLLSAVTGACAAYARLIAGSHR